MKILGHGAFGKVFLVKEKEGQKRLLAMKSILELSQEKLALVLYEFYN